MKPYQKPKFFLVTVSCDVLMNSLYDPYKVDKEWEDEQ